MSLDVNFLNRLHKALGVVDDRGTAGPRLVDDARRLWERVQRFIGMRLVDPTGLDLTALELACHALQLPQRRARTLPTGRTARSTLRERSEEAAELLIGVAGGDASEELLDRTTRVLHEVPHRSPMLEESKLIADALSLEDFGVTGLLARALDSGRQGGGILQLIHDLDKRDQYGYWEARLKDSFHFEPIRKLALDRLADARKIADLLRGELHEDKL